MEEDILDIIYKIQEARNPKYFLWQIIKDMEWVDSKHNSNFLIGKKNDLVYFNYNKINHELWYSYNKIYSVLKTKYYLNEVKANKLVNSMVSERTKIKVDTTEID